MMIEVKIVLQNYVGCNGREMWKYQVVDDLELLIGEGSDYHTPTSALASALLDKADEERGVSESIP